MNTQPHFDGTSGSCSIPKANRERSAKIADDIEKFLLKGGEIKQCETFKRTDDDIKNGYGKVDYNTRKPKDLGSYK